jgi:class 3 adenylate cyclase
MIRYIPPFILEKASRKEYRGSFNGFILILDIVDFTHIAEGFQQGGLLGADSIGNLLNQISRGLIEPINRYGGFVGLFIGDAICAIFPEADPSCLLAALGDIRRYLSSFCAILPDLGNSNISMREAISYGRIDWAIYPVNSTRVSVLWQTPFGSEHDVSPRALPYCKPQALEENRQIPDPKRTDEIQLICPIDPSP